MLQFKLRIALRNARFLSFLLQKMSSVTIMWQNLVVSIFQQTLSF